MENSLTTQQSTSSRWGWYLFDFANSVLIVNGGLYFPQWLVIDNGISDFVFNATIVLSTVVVFLTGPPLGRLMDSGWSPLRLLCHASVAMFFGGLVIGIGGRFLSNQPLRVWSALLSFFIIMSAYQLSLVFYNALLADVSHPQKYTRVSGWGLAAGWIGGIIAVLLILPFVSGMVPFFQPAGRIQAILPSTLIYGILTVASLYLMRNIRPPVSQQPSPITLSKLRRDSLKLFADLPHRRPILLFLIGYLFFSDAVLTIQNNSTIYMDRVLQFSDTIKAYQFILVLAAGAVGAVLIGGLVDKIGLKQALVGTLIAWTLIVAATSLTRSGVLFTVGFGVMGFLNGALWNLSRVAFLLLIPLDQRGGYFGIYSTFERVASVVGPLVWSAPVTLLTATDAGRYQVAMFLMAVLLGASVLPISRLTVPTPQTTDSGA